MCSHDATLPLRRPVETSAELSARLRYELVWKRPPPGMPALINVSLQRCGEVTFTDFLRSSPIGVAPATGEPLAEPIVEAVQATIDEGRSPARPRGRRPRMQRLHARPDRARLAWRTRHPPSGAGSELREPARESALSSARDAAHCDREPHARQGDPDRDRARRSPAFALPWPHAAKNSGRAIAVPGWREKYGDDDVVVSSRGDGCLMIIEDSRAARKPRIYCDSCNSKGPGLERRALAAVKNAWKGNVVTNTGERSVVCKCGERFRTAKEKVQRCPRCEKKHA